MGLEGPLQLKPVQNSRIFWYQLLPITAAKLCQRAPSPQEAALGWDGNWDVMELGCDGNWDVMGMGRDGKWDVMGNGM